MSKEGKEPNSENSHQEDTLSYHPEFGFVYNFFISEEKSGSIEKKTAIDQPQEKKESELKFDDPSVKFFLPDLFADEF
ncbi:MAG: hypothetical protein ACXWMK_08865 [Syntrophales bacterium]